MARYIIPAGTTALTPFVPNIQYIDTAQLPSENILIEGSGICYVRLPQISDLQLSNALLTIVATSSDANISISPSGLDCISTIDGLVGSDSQMVVTGQYTTVGVNTVLPTGLSGTSAALWFSPSTSSHENTDSFYLFGNQVIDFVNNNSGQDSFIVTFNRVLQHRKIPVGFTAGPIPLTIEITLYVNNSVVRSYVSTTQNVVGLFGNGAGTYMCKSSYQYQDVHGNMVFLNNLCIVKVDGSGNILNKLNLEGVFPAQIVGLNIDVIAKENQFFFPPTSFDWYFDAVSNPSIGTGYHLVYTMPAASNTNVIGKMTLAALEWPDVYSVINAGTDGLLSFNIITQ